MSNKKIKKTRTERGAGLHVVETFYVTLSLVSSLGLVGWGRRSGRQKRLDLGDDSGGSIDRLFGLREGPVHIGRDPFVPLPGGFDRSLLAALLLLDEGLFGVQQSTAGTCEYSHDTVDPILILVESAGELSHLFPRAFWPLGHVCFS